MTSATVAPYHELYGLKFSGRAKGKLNDLGQNRTEAAYDAVLAGLLQAGQILWYKFEALKLRLADGAYYTPDFAVMTADGYIECHETKGFWREAGRVRIKVAAEHFPFRFVAVKMKAKKDGGGWEYEEF